MSFEQWALVEVMGHTRLAGLVTEEEIAGVAFLRVDVPAVEGLSAFTRYIGPKSVHSLTPVAKDVAHMMAARIKAAPIRAWGVPGEWRETWAAKALPGPVAESPAPTRSTPCPECSTPLTWGISSAGMHG